MHTVSQMDPNLYAKALKKQTELVDRIIDVLTGEWERGWSRRWSVDPQLSVDDVMEDLEFGRD